MKTNKTLNWIDCQLMADVLASRILEHFKEKNKDYISIYGIPRGGIHIAQLLCSYKGNSKGVSFRIVDRPEQASAFVDDIVDSGATKEYWNKQYPEIPFFGLVERTESNANFWYVFPWETTELNGPEDSIRRILEFIGEDPNREGLIETPKRIIKSYTRLFGGYGKNPEDLMKVFEDGACNEMVVLKNIHFYSTCEHHMLPFFGKAHVAYIPNGKVIGVSKLARLVDMFARRMQIQERIGTQVVEALMKYLNAKGAACIIEAQHMCMTARGVENQTSKLTTSALRGAFLENPQTRMEFLQIIKEN